MIACGRCGGGRLRLRFRPWSNVSGRLFSTCLWSHSRHGRNSWAQFSGRSLVWRKRKRRRVAAAAAVRASARSSSHPPTAVRAASELRHRDDDAITRRRPKYHRPSASTPPPPRPHTIHTITLAAPPLRPGESPPRLLSASCSEPRARMCLPTPVAPRIYVRREHTDPLPCPSRRQPRRSLQLLATGHSAKQTACHRYPHSL